MADKTPEAVEVETVREEVDAQVAPPRDPDADKVSVHEVRVTLDKVITDPTDPLAVQIPDEVKQDLTLPIHDLDQGSAEQKLADADEDEGVQDREAGTEPTDAAPTPAERGVVAE